jgi:glycosyltransferase involved in cell wall biosynthesis
VRILFLNHTGGRSGAENAMLRLLEGLPPEHPRAVACPSNGALARALKERGIRQFELSGTALSFSLHPVKTPLGLFALLRSALALRAAARRYQADVIHANSVRAGLIAVLARRLGGPPVVVQCHDHLPDTRAGAVTRHALVRGAEIVVAVSDTSAAHFNEGLVRPKAERVYISVDHARFSPRYRASASIRTELELPPDARVVAQVAQITPWKNQELSILALARIRRNCNAHLLVVGDIAFSSARYDNVGYCEHLGNLARQLGIADAVHFLGNRADVEHVLGAAELLLLPSWDEPFGLVVAEAMAVGVPVLVTEVGGVPEYVTDGVNGRVLPPRNADLWAAAAGELLNDDEALERISRANVEKASEFTDERYGAAMLDAYRRAIAA